MSNSFESRGDLEKPAAESIKSMEPGPREAGKASRAWLGALGTTLGCVVAIVIFLSFVLWAAAFFTEKPEAKTNPVVIDDAGVLTPESIAAIEAIRFPRDIPAVVRTVNSIPIAKIGTYATDAMAEEAAWNELRPRGFLRKYFRQDAPWGTGVYVLVSMDPALLQIRFGEEIRLRAYREGLATGPWYRERQRFPKDGLNDHVTQTVRELAQTLEQAGEPRWPMTWVYFFASVLYSEIEDFLAPGDGPFSSTVLQYHIRLIDSLGGTTSAWSFVLVSLLCVLVFWLLFNKLLIERLLLPFLRSRFARSGIVFTSEVTLLAFVVAAVATIAVLGRGRIEDELALARLGLSSLGPIGFDPSLYATPGGLWLAIPGGLIAVGVDFFQTLVSSKESGGRSVNIQLGFILWAAVLFILPKAIGYFLLAYLFVQVIASFKELVSGD
ncbi:MAG: hypothetical protein WD696_03070 [Bryobacteraceae bacterium]